MAEKENENQYPKWIALYPKTNEPSDPMFQCPCCGGIIGVLPWVITYLSKRPFKCERCGTEMLGIDWRRSNDEV